MKGLIRGLMRGKNRQREDMRPPRGLMLTRGTLTGLSFIQRYRFLTIPQFARTANFSIFHARDVLRTLEGVRAGTPLFRGAYTPICQIDLTNQSDGQCRQRYEGFHNQGQLSQWQGNIFPKPCLAVIDPVAKTQSTDRRRSPFGSGTRPSLTSAMTPGRSWPDARAWRRMPTQHRNKHLAP
jgi:hypothetical protein